MKSRVDGKVPPQKGTTKKRPRVGIQGLGFVGAAMAAAVASACDEDGSPAFDVIGIDLETPQGKERISAINSGKFPFETSDAAIRDAVERAHRTGNLTATSDPVVLNQATIAIMDVHCDVTEHRGEPKLEMDGLRAAARTLGRHLPEGALIVVETTVPPGTCEKIVAPELDLCLKARGLLPGSLLLAHSYERVMPGRGYFDSVVNFWRVYSGTTPRAADACEAFLSRVIDVRRFPLTRLHSTTASETAKILENSYRATTIAFMEEWGRFAEAAGIDLFEVVSAIRVRPTHSNIRQPGFGVGGYCLTKDPLFAELAARDLFGRPELKFPFCRQAVETNREMPLVSLERLTRLLGGDLKGKRILLMGVSYRPDVADTRYSPSAPFAAAALKLGARLVCHDPMVRDWPELNLEVARTLPPAEVDAVVIAVRHQDYCDMDWARWLGPSRPVILDSNDVLSSSQRHALRKLGCRVESIGRGEGL